MKTQGYPTRTHTQSVKRYCQTLDLKDDSELIRAYRSQHGPDRMWHEIIDGIRSVGILEMEIYILRNRLFMIVDTPSDFDWDEAMAKLSRLPRQQEWEEVVAAFQQCSRDATSDEKWQMMERMFYLYDR